jgi:hypothetical protein
VSPSLTCEGASRAYLGFCPVSDHDDPRD